MRLGRRLWLAIFVLGLLAPGSRAATPDPIGAGGAWIDSLLDGTGAALGGVGMLAASALGGAGDLVEGVDRNRWTARWLHGGASGAIQHLAFGVSYGATSLLERLRREDIERLPEPRAAYLDSAYGAGRGWTALDGLAALWVGVGDWTAGPARALLRLVGARGAAQGLEHARREAALRWLGPEPAARRAATGISRFRVDSQRTRDEETSDAALR
ncbi:MAG: hypothetical protein ACE5IL_02790 [Myxococcota bacterium]